MKLKLFFLIVTLLSTSVYAKDVCVIFSDDARVISECTITTDSESDFANNVYDALSKKVKIIKALLLKGYVQTSESTFIKN